MSTFIIPDIHGCIKTLRRLIDCKLGITIDDRLYFLGDYIDRGPDSAGVVDYLINLKETGFNVNFLLGNHEQMLLDSCDSKENLNLWLQNSGLATLKSYGIHSISKLNVLKSIPSKHLDFYKELKPYFIVNEKYVLVHGGINYSSVNPFSDINGILWSRLEQVPDDFMPNYTFICGHNLRPIDFIIRDIQLRKKRIFRLDAGCVFKDFLPGTGYLTALNIDKWELDFVECID